MTELLTAAQMRTIEQAAIASGEVTGLELMERAGRGVVEAVFEEWPDLAKTSHRAVVLCGPGNNGGDGFVVARLLKEWGWEVEVFLYGDPNELPPDAKANYERWGRLGRVAPSTRFSVAGPIDLCVDALFGSGLSRPLTGEAAECSLKLGGERLVSIDAPSGLCLDSGRLLADPTGSLPFASVPFADLTVTFHASKIGHFLASGPSRCGKLHVADIGLNYRKSWAVLKAISDGPSGTRKDPGAVVTKTSRLRYEADGHRQGKPLLAKVAECHKFSHGHALVLSGGPSRGGAGRLAARGALRIGAGVVTLGCPPAALQENAAQLNAVMLKSLGSDEDLALLLGEETRISALCLGPGMGTGVRERQLVAAALAANRKMVLDADALTLIAGDAALFKALHKGCVLTPHHGEFARLFPDIAAKLDVRATHGPAYSKVDATRAAAARAGCVVLFKGPDTVIADPSGRCSINSAHYDRAAPWLATAGSGDVQAGFIAGLLARGFAPMGAAETAAWLHVECARSFGPGLIAEDLPEELPKVFRALGL